MNILEKQVNNGRISKLREVVRLTPQLCVERGYWMTESYKETESDPPVIRRAKALKKILSEMTIHIEDGELIVGRVTSKRRGGPQTPEINWNWALAQMGSLPSAWDDFAPVTEEEKPKIQQVLDYWKGKSLNDKLSAIVPKEMLDLHAKVMIPAGSCLGNMHLGSHDGADFQMLITKGLKGIKKQVDERLAKLNLTNVKDLKKSQFLNAVTITLDAAIDFAKRYAGLARKMANETSDSQRREELGKIAEICEWVPANPARTFYEAMQSVWLTYVVLMIEGWGPGMSFGRPDQYLYPLYKNDIETNNITREQAKELIELFCIKVNELALPFGIVTQKTAAGLNVLSNITLGGVTKDGKDAVNELSYLFLDAEEEVGMHADEFVIRIHKNNPDAFVMRACKVAKSLRGKLKFVGDETAIQQLMRDGKPLENARDYIVSGCVLPTVPGCSFDVIGGQFNLPLMLELALNNGVSRVTGEQIGPRTGDARKFNSYEQVLEAYKKQVEAVVKVVTLVKNTDRELFAEFAPTPFQSAFFPACIERATDITAGGTAPYVTNGISAIGTPNVGDSLAAIKKAVFDDKKVTMDRLIDALDKNFAGEEETLSILKKAPKFGNDDDYVDSIVHDVLMHFCEEVKKYEGYAGSIFNVTAYTASGNLQLGSVVGALPDGRKSGEPLSEGGISPYQGRNVNGPTATMRSVTKLDLANVSGGSALNMRFNPEALKDEIKMQKFASMVRTYFETGGYHVQFNIVDANMLRDAQKYPEKYKDLLVRVSTYSAYFVQLCEECQNEIIARTEF